MGADTAISWTDRTFNPWWGCSRVSPACRSCYADATATRWGHELWRRRGPRRMLSDANWAQPLKWNREAAAQGAPLKVFCASMADVFEIHPVAEVNAQLDAARDRLWTLIGQTPWLIWQVLTKRPENASSLAPWGADWPDNVWLGTSVEDQRRADQRIPILLDIPVTRFLSCEPLLSRVDLYHWFGLDWVIIGGESGPRHRVMDLGHLKTLIDQCRAASIPVWVKQDSGPRPGMQGRIPDRWWIKEFPNAY